MNFHYLNIPSKVPASIKTTSFISLGEKRKNNNLCIIICQSLNSSLPEEKKKIAEIVLGAQLGEGLNI